MSDGPKLRVLYGDAKALPDWPDRDATELRESVEAGLAEGDQILLVVLKTGADGQRTARHWRSARGARASHFELVGALHMMMHDWQDEE